MAENTFTLNQRTVAFMPGQTILEAATAAGVRIPTLCHLRGTTPTGACRICVVEVAGARSLLTACSTPAASKMVVQTESSRVVKARKTILELLLASGEHDCLLCPSCGDCQLQDLAFEYQVSLKRFDRWADFRKTEANPLIVRDFSRCILCGRCVQACNEVQVNRAISFGYRGKEAKIVAAGDRPLQNSECVFCGECIQVCPTGALSEDKARTTWRPWKERQRVRTTCPYCGVGCQIWLHVKGNQVLKVTGVEGVPPNRGRLCVKGRFGYDFINAPDRLTTPLIKENGSFREASWDEALDLVATRLAKIKEVHGARSLAGFTSARATNEENYLMQKLVRTGFGTNNIDHCARL
jgi:NADP-reducing hydrogenase subunit HndD